MANAYLKMKKKHQDETNAFPLKFAFSNDQFKKAMEEWGLTENDTDKICGIGGGGYILKTDKDAFVEMFKRHSKEMQEAIDADETGEGFVYDMFDYELANHEYCITWEVDDTLLALGLTEEEVNASPKLLKALKAACKANQYES